MGRTGNIRKSEQIEKVVTLVGQDQARFTKEAAGWWIILSRRERYGSRQAMAVQCEYLLSASKAGRAEAAWHHSLEQDAWAQETKRGEFPSTFKKYGVLMKIL